MLKQAEQSKLLGVTVVIVQLLVIQFIALQMFIVDLYIVQDSINGD